MAKIIIENAYLKSQLGRGRMSLYNALSRLLKTHDSIVTIYIHEQLPTKVNLHKEVDGTLRVTFNNNYFDVISAKIIRKESKIKIFVNWLLIELKINTAREPTIEMNIEDIIKNFLASVDSILILKGPNGDTVLAIEREKEQISIASDLIESQ